MPMIKRLGSGEWFTSRASASGLFHFAYEHASSTTQSELRKLFASLCNDETPMVKRAAAANLGVILEILIQ